MGADSAGVRGLDITIRKDPKIYRVGPTLIGFTTSFRMGQLLGTSLVIPERHPNTDVYRWMTTSFIDAIRDCLKTGGWSGIKETGESSEVAGNFLVAYEGRIFEIFSDLQVGESFDDYAACGCGEPYAKGSFFSSSRIAPEERVHLALSAAEYNSAGVKGPFTVEVL
jgi:hypothetical protein